MELLKKANSLTWMVP